MSEQGPDEERTHAGATGGDDAATPPLAAGGGDPAVLPLVTVPPSVTLTHVLDETVLMHAQSGVYYGLNDTGRRMLDLSRAMTDAREVVDALAAEFPAEPVARAELEADLYGLLARLEQEGLVELSPGIADAVSLAAERLPPPGDRAP